MVAEPDGKQWKTDSLEGLSKNSKVWCLTDDDEYVIGTILALDNPSCVRVQLDGPHGSQWVEQVSADKLKPANPAILEGVEDLTHLSYLNEPSLLHNLRVRHTSDNIYTTAGPVLIAVNPYKRLPLYGPDMVAKYRGCNGGKKCKEPHPFVVADATYAALMADRQSQSVVISGESGAGKTETTKIVMQYLAGLAGGTGIEDRILQTNPILEGFGNAKTLRNNNSSRFGKLINIFFHGRTIAGARISTYLLEKSRVVKQGEGERSYHIFYQLVAGASEEERKAWHLPDDPEDFQYLSSSGCSIIDGVDDEAEFSDMKAAMDKVGINAEEQAALFQLVSAVMWLGNIKFKELGDETVEVVAGEALEHSADLLCCDPAALCKALTGKQIKAGTEVIWQQLRIDQANDTRDALAKALYAALFDWLVRRINESLGDPKKLKKAQSINILDIYGFEHFKVNSFEQLCINFANERLQQQFNKYLFKLEQEEYAREGIDWAHVDFEDNQECVDLIEQKMPRGVGVLSLLDEECVFPKATDETFGEKLAANLSSHPNFSSKSQSVKNEFTVKHYAGPVTYNTAGFLDKNKDSVSVDLLGALQGSGLPLLAAVAGSMLERQTAKNSMTVGSFFRDQLRLLVDTLESTQLHFVRCIKPNPEQAPLLVDHGLVLAQLRCCGVLEVVRIARAGYPTRYLHEAFADRYHILLPEASSSAGDGAGFSGPPLEVCQKILRQFQIDPAMYQVGHTKLFFRAGLLGRMEDTWERMVHGAFTIQAFMRMAVVRARFLHLRGAAVVVQSRRKGALQRRSFAELIVKHRAALVIGSRWRGCLARRRFRHAIASAVCIQRAFRYWCARRGLRLRRSQRLEEEAAQKEEAGRWDRVRDEFGGDWETIRATMAFADRIKHRLGVEEEEEAERALATLEVASRAATLAKGGVAVSEEEAAEVADLKAEVERLRADREALLDEVQAEKGRREECEERLEAAEEQWMAQMASLQEVLANVKSELTGGNPEAAVAVFAGDLERFRDRLPAHHAEAGTATASPNGATVSRLPAAAAPSPADSRKPRASEDLKAIQAVDRLKDDFDMRTQVYDDDIDFIREVKDGRTDAPDMDPAFELKQLSHRFENWKRDFKHRLHEAKHLLRKDRQDRSESISFISPDTTMDMSDMTDQHLDTAASRQQSDKPHHYATPKSAPGWSPPPSVPSKHHPSSESKTPRSYDSGTDSGSTKSQYISAEMVSPGFTVAASEAHLPHPADAASLADKRKEKKKGLGKMLGFGKRGK
mmetsp:Transcript_33071/g.93600  ORF Transcript_33071/g.93600 Transcript_33071/m.93600 type:complete len:1272 (+) Transcript_33071:218-4033(+)|eukprot:CAMPEP_0117662340 /NCGR_PEP_ID=MMETSP0804-20121206/8004_1 /TAXON_ID=1074897 /ORGANISM="Tetraselmis astigmatica, Strain CCMP880" /LENGTH=1271 /DNA_ID=CAMNT_0005469239 /DNA_START=307 /DNA_END=4122 /DNA_ORIENTATION=+